MNFLPKTIHMEVKEKFGGGVLMVMNGRHKLNHALYKVMVVDNVDI